MKLFILGLIILLILVCQIYKIIKEKNPKNKKKEISEPYSLDTDEDGEISLNEYKNFVKYENRFFDDNINYYDDLLHNNKEIKKIKKKKNEYNKWVYFNSKNELILEEFKVRDETNNNIEKCRAITSCDMLDNPEYKDCGYCGALGEQKDGEGGPAYNQVGKFDYMPSATGGKKIGPDICPADALEPHKPKGQYKKKELGNRWAVTARDCHKVQKQDKCSSVKNCSGINSDEFKDICGWCPGNKAYAKNINGGLLYNERIEQGTNTDIYRIGENGEKIFGDTCDALNEVYKNEKGVTTPYFEKLLKGSECSSCDNEGGGEYKEGPDGIQYYHHSEQCLKDLWETPLITEDLNIACTTDFDANPEYNEGGLWEKNYRDFRETTDDSPKRNVYNWGREKYYKVQKNMQKDIQYPIYSFKDTYNTNLDLGAGTKSIWSYGDAENEESLIDRNTRNTWKKDDNYLDTEPTSAYYLTEHRLPRTNVKNLWKRCFNKENENNELRCEPIDSIRAMEDNIELIDENDENNTNTKDDYYQTWKGICNNLTGDYKCEMKLDENGEESENGKKMCQIPDIKN